MLRLTSVCVFLFFALALAVSSGYSFGASILLVSSVALLWQRPSLELQRRDYLLIAALLLYFSTYAANVYWHDDPMRELDMSVRALLAIPVMLLLIAYPPRPAAWWSGVAIGAIAGLALAIWQVLVLQVERPLAATSNAIHFGNGSMLLGMLSLCGISWAREQRRSMAWSLLVIAGAVSGVIGALLSGSRGGWLALPFCICIIALENSKTLKKKYITCAVGALLALVAVAYALPNSSLNKRTSIAIEEMRTFKHGSDLTLSSVGQRMEMWSTAIALSGEHPWDGVGLRGYIAEKRELTQEGKMSVAIRDYTNAHNDYLDSMVKRGITGLLPLLALFIVPLIIFARTLRQGTPIERPYALAGVVLLTCYMVFGLTTTSLTINIGVTLLVFPMVMLWSLLRHARRTA